MSKLEKYLFDLSNIFRTYIGTSVKLYNFYAFCRKRHKLWYVNKDTDITIEGYPRSANTYAYCAFLVGQEKEVKVAHHLHVIAQIEKSIKFGIPTLVLVRNPLEAILSNLVAYKGSNINILINYYIQYHREIYRNRKKLVIGHFDQVIQDFGSTIKEVNSKYSTNFKIYHPTIENEKKVSQLIKKSNEIYGNNIRNQISRPSQYKEKLKMYYIQKLDSNKHKIKLKNAYILYDRIINDV